MADCKGCPHEGYCIPDDCGLLNKKEPPPCWRRRRLAM